MLAMSSVKPLRVPCQCRSRLFLDQFHMVKLITFVCQYLNSGDRFHAKPLVHALQGHEVIIRVNRGWLVLVAWLVDPGLLRADSLL